MLLPTVDGAPKGLKALGGTPESYYTTLIFFVISILLCFQAISDVAGTADEWSSMLLSLFFLVCASSWLCKQVRDRADVNNEMWEKDEKMTKVILFLARTAIRAQRPTALSTALLFLILFLSSLSVFGLALFLFLLFFCSCPWGGSCLCYLVIRSSPET